MIIIITGSSHTGKTLFAQRILEKYRIPYLSIDHLKMGLIKSGNTDLTAEDDEEIYFVAEELHNVFPDLTFTPVSFCAGILSISL